MFRKAREIDFNLTLLTVADTHNSLNTFKEIKIPKPSEYDLCIFLGDISKEDIRILLQYIPKEKIIGVLGNHDDNDNLELFGIKNINNTIYYYNEISFIGLQGCIKYKENQPCYTQKESKEFCKNMPAVDIFITHDVPANFMLHQSEVHKGNPAINKYLSKNKCPLNICGHNHTYKIDKLKNGTYVAELMDITLLRISPNKIITQKIETR
jgi:predicted phosphodiesterase